MSKYKFFSLIVALALFFSACDKNQPFQEDEVIGVKASVVAAQTVYLKGSGSSFNGAGWTNVFNVVAEEELGQYPNVWHLEFTGTFGNVTGMQLTFTNGEAFTWTPEMGASVNGGGKNPGWVIYAPYNWEIAYVNKGNNNESESFLVAINEKNVNFNISGFTAGKADDAKPVIVNLGFIGYYLYDGNVLSTSIHWQDLKEGDMIDWDAVDAAYDEWVAQGGLEPDRTIWQTSGYASFTFDDYAALGFGDFNIGQVEDYYKAYYVDPGYVPPCTPMTAQEIIDEFNTVVEAFKTDLLESKYYSNWKAFENHIIAEKTRVAAAAEEWNTCNSDFDFDFDFDLKPLPDGFTIENNNLLIDSELLGNILAQTNGQGWLSVTVNDKNIDTGGDWNTNSKNLIIKSKALTGGTYIITVTDPATKIVLKTLKFSLIGDEYIIIEE